MQSRILGMRGSSVLEVAIVTMLSLGLLLGAVGVSDVLMTSYRISQAVDAVAFDHSLKPLRIDGDGRVVLDEATIAKSLRALADRAVTAINGALVGAEHEYRIELELAVVHINPLSGRVERITMPEAFSQVRGNLTLTSVQRAPTRFEREFERLAGTPGEVSPYAIPMAGVSGSGDQFFPVVALLGVRAFVSLEGSPTAHALHRLGTLEDKVVYDWKVVPVRGEVSTL